MKPLTYYVRVVGSYNEGLGYIDHVFENLNTNDPDMFYIAAVQFPNWNQPKFEPGDIGYVTIEYVEEGVDKWYDGKGFHSYNNTMCIFIKFRPEQLKVTKEIVLD